jgi:hypothetical protein
MGTRDFPCGQGAAARERRSRIGPREFLIGNTILRRDPLVKDCGAFRRKIFVDFEFQAEVSGRRPQVCSFANRGARPRSISASVSVGPLRKSSLRGTPGARLSPAPPSRPLPRFKAMRNAAICRACRGRCGRRPRSGCPCWFRWWFCRGRSRRRRKTRPLGWAWSPGEW